MERKARDSCGKYVSKGDPTGAKGAEEAPGPPAESERLQWKGTVVVQTLQNGGQIPFSCKVNWNRQNLKPKKTEDKLHFIEFVFSLKEAASFVSYLL
ncbi:hypothetical protein ACQKKK_09000 [Peribacillus sp. NPDC006672]|uniref:hypothetical protein n=1 Tax=Peribacillus sp. NPDC006672 TaxID=3390606 RepID=UPI003D04E320